MNDSARTITLALIIVTLITATATTLAALATHIAADYYRARTPPAVMHYAEADGR